MNIKICGITNVEDGQFAVDNGADYVGFIFYHRSPRYIEPEALKDWVGELKSVRKVGVFVNERNEDILKIVRQCCLDVVQLHGDEDGDDIESLQKAGVEVWRAFSLKSQLDVEDAIACVADKILVDSISSSEYGGSGKVCNWELAKSLASKRDMILAGGLNPENVVEAIQLVHPYCVDVSSGVELKPGKKDLVKLLQFLKVKGK
ncbi:MAG: phosphoribosylanthranilate isomerase [Kiritimatiellae bacterium]|jgi:phosphoribosylanthranilate isomerase|nr:phosphoribosylanthranilate isomerase [Kiritimatiellia bacterium]